MNGFFGDGFGMMIIGDEPPEHIPSMPPNIVPGRNIKTGCYGLFLVALDQCESKTERKVLEKARDVIEDIQGCVVFNALGMHYPPDKLEYEDILNLARCVLVLYKKARHVHAEDVPLPTIMEIEKAMVDILGLREGLVQITDDCTLDETDPEIAAIPRQLDLDMGLDEGEFIPALPDDMPPELATLIQQAIQNPGQVFSMKLGDNDDDEDHNT